MGNKQPMIFLLDLMFIIRDSHLWYHKFSLNLKFLPSPNKYPVQITPTSNLIFSGSLYLQQRQNLQVQLSALQSDYDNLNARYEEESEAASNLRAQLSRVNAEFAALKTRYDKELLAKTEEMEEMR